ncbi:oligopeptide transport system substrate-binding protein [Caulobacter ginsengisoli]|uniref:Oligopeptide transport system substrate-binding protein n=1 Tax=Caulobacter ginsengisoli TaxID=400775 RepID=A0ABU0INC5_9CAUL|nr:peptide ABC transporter substrate-binding protein [Caulobacter ginsengisoli]MDQ0463459.1 oligopeptide transport system substrate-binding protein [Caulobacter ginsengisoli]
MIRNLFLILAAVTLLAACGSKPSLPPCPKGKVCLQIGNTSEPLTLDPHKSTGTWEDRIESDVLMGLAQSGPDGKPIPGMAESWTTSPDGLTWTFHLRDAEWSDGAPLTAQDFVFSIRRILSPETASEYASNLYAIKNAQPVSDGKLPLTALGVEAPDPHTLIIRLEHPAAYLLQLVKHHTMYPVPEHVIAKWGDAWVKPGHFVGNGPYMLKAWRLGDYVQVVKNPRFFDADKVCVDEIYYYPTADAISGERQVARGELDINTDIQSNRISLLRQKMPAYVHTNTYLGVVYLAFNRSKKSGYPPFADKRVRLALSMAVDREFIAAKLLRGGQQPAYMFVPPGTANYTSPAPPDWAAWPFEKRQAEARRLLREAGYGPGHPLKLEIKHRNSADPMLFMPAIQADWKAIGVEASLAQEEVQIAYADYRARSYQVADASWIGDYNDPMTFLYLQRSNTGAQNYGDYANPVYDALLTKADETPDPQARAAILGQAETLMLSDAPIVPIYYLINKNLVNPKVSGFVDNIVDQHRSRWLCAKPAA